MRAATNMTDEIAALAMLDRAGGWACWHAAHDWAGGSPASPSCCCHSSAIVTSRSYEQARATKGLGLTGRGSGHGWNTTLAGG